MLPALAFFCGWLSDFATLSGGGLNADMFCPGDMGSKERSQQKLEVRNLWSTEPRSVKSPRAFHICNCHNLAKLRAHETKGKDMVWQPDSLGHYERLAKLNLRNMAELMQGSHAASWRHPLHMKTCARCDSAMSTAQPAVLRSATWQVKGCSHCNLLQRRGPKI